MARYTDGIIPSGVELGVTLDRYQEIMRLPPAAFNGLYRELDEAEYECGSPENIWRQSDRDNLAMNIADAEEMREQEVGFYLAPKYVDEDLINYEWPIVLSPKYLIAIGTQKTEDISIGEVVDHTGSPDPIVLTVTTAVDPSEIKVYYPGEDVEIHPTRITSDGVDATITILRSRLVKPDVSDNNDLRLEHIPRYDDDGNFLTSVDIKRVYLDTTEGFEYVWLPLTGINQATERTQAGLSVITNHKLSIVEHRPATYNGNWTLRGFSYCPKPNKIRISYLSGRQSSMRTEEQTARLSHTMPAKLSPCSLCWEDDLKPHPSKLTTPYGTTYAGVEAWIADSRAKIAKAGIFPGMRRVVR